MEIERKSSINSVFENKAINSEKQKTFVPLYLNWNIPLNFYNHSFNKHSKLPNVISNELSVKILLKLLLHDLVFMKSYKHTTLRHSILCHQSNTVRSIFRVRIVHQSISLDCLEKSKMHFWNRQTKLEAECVPTPTLACVRHRTSNILTLRCYLIKWLCIKP